LEAQAPQTRWEPQAMAVAEPCLEDRHRASHQPRRPVNEGVHREPYETHEIPVQAVVVAITEMLAFDRTEPEKRGEHPRLDCLEKKQRAVKRNRDPCCRCVCVRIPMRVQIAEIVHS